LGGKIDCSISPKSSPYSEAEIARSQQDGNKPASVATGNWGCGAFGGDPQLKSLLQLMAAAECGRDVAYFTFGDRKLRDELDALHKMLLDRKTNTKSLLSFILSYG